MIFNSLQFLFFLPIVFLLYWKVFNKDLTVQNVLLLAASYIFYGWWDYRFLGLILISSVVDFLVAQQIEKEGKVFKRKMFLMISILVNLGILSVFKYFNFFIDSFADLLGLFNLQVNRWSLQLILPVGISFYTFQTLSYTIDVYRKEMKASKDWISFFAYVSYFPQLVAGPIERAKKLLPQFEVERSFNLETAKDGLRQMLFGFFKKIVIADNCAIAANAIFDNYQEADSLTLIWGSILFAFQIYGDFSGYSDIAIGTSKLFGIRLSTNFAYPYFSRDIGEFWRRWHISLSTWFRDYIYIPLGGSRVKNKWFLFRNVMIIFIVSGFWHGANWTYIAWGGLNGLLFFPLIFLDKNRRNLDIVAKDSFLPSIKDAFSILITFLLVCLTWIFFRSENLLDAFLYIQRIFSFDFNGIPQYVSCLPYVLVLLILEWIFRRDEHPLKLKNINKPVRWLIYYSFIFCIFYFMPSEAIDFIYFQF